MIGPFGWLSVSRLVEIRAWLVRITEDTTYGS